MFITSKAKQSRESAMQTHQADYFGAYRTMKMMRDANGVLVVEFHSNGGRCTFSAQHHTEVVDAFHRIAQDRANKIVILTGAEATSLLGSIGTPLAMFPIPVFGARFTTKALRFWKT
jgi:1,4-dihydroxy-2-naphthoyl-CoA synthase